MKSLFRSLSHALRGLKRVAQHEANFRLELAIACVVIALVFVVPLDMWERILLILMTSAVLVLEVLNTVFERISDALKPRLHPIVKEVKDMMAGAVLLTSITAVVVAIMIFWSYIVDLILEFGYNV